MGDWETCLKTGGKHFSNLQKDFSSVQELELLDSPLWGHKDDEESGIFSICRKAESWDCSAWGREGSGDLIGVYKYLREGANTMERGSFQ